MKLIGSKTEQDFREELIASHQYLFQDKKDPQLLNVLQTLFPEMKTAYILHWTPEQGEDIYTILINTNLIATIELDRENINADPIVEAVSIVGQKTEGSRLQQIKLAVAIDLAQKDLNTLGDGLPQ